MERDENQESLETSEEDKKLGRFVDDLKEFFEGEVEDEIEGEKKQLFEIKISKRKTKKVLTLKKVTEDNSLLLDYLFAFIGVSSDDSLPLLE